MAQNRVTPSAEPGRPQRPVIANPNPLRSRQQNTTPDRYDTPVSEASSSEQVTPATTWYSRHSRRRKPHFTSPEPWRNWKKLVVILRNVPPSWGTPELHKLLLDHGASPVRIDVSGGENRRPGNAKVIFKPPPPGASQWIHQGLNVTSIAGVKMHIHCRYELETSQEQMNRQLGKFEELELEGRALRFGVLKDVNMMLVMRSVEAQRRQHVRLVVNLKMQQMELHFVLITGPQGKASIRNFFFRIPLSEIRSIKQNLDPDGSTQMYLQLAAPPLAFRKILNVQDTHNAQANIWDERQTWYRQTSIETDPVFTTVRRTQLRNEESIIDIGRWLCYQFVCEPASQAPIDELRVVLAKHNIAIEAKPVECVFSEARSQWDWLGSSVHSSASSEDSSLAHIDSTGIHLPFPVQYQLEACISHGCLHESNLTIAWLQRLLEQDRDDYTGMVDLKYTKATKILERVVQSKQQFHDPMDVFTLSHRISVLQKPIPNYCTMVRSATVTPTTIYFHSPSVDTSNRIIRKFSEHADRFLRVKFRDESYKGMIMTFGDDTTNELFTRINRTLRDGIVVGDRHYKFLAYGNSQFREHGAYFFAPTSTLTADMIRSWMGDFEGIKTVAKYASRLGQCFSTTRATTNSVTVRHIEDIERNGYCFTDGVGKISPFSMQMATRDLNLPTQPSAIQFRLGGCKGILAVDPGLKGAVIEVRPSQTKFPAPHKGLEICRVSQFATAYLNQQIVLVLSALGVPDGVFLDMLCRMLADLETSMSDEFAAMKLLLGNIDQNHATVNLASMISDGFMETHEPFFMSLLRLWRSWSVKYLKEKAKIFVQKGAFVMGTVDESGTLKGHSDLAPTSDTTHNVDMLPEIFLQVEDFNNRGTYKVVEGICVLLRNPSLHPGDARVVRAVDKPGLGHHRDTVVLPSEGDRDIAGMCSGGDLDGDDYLIIWDEKLIPKEWNHAPMDYTAPQPVRKEDPITVDDITSFFVTHMKYDNLGRIATAHRYWADKMEEGIKHENCLELAALHSKAVDYPKTGVAAEMPKHLKAPKIPHWAWKPNNRPQDSTKTLQQMKDEGRVHISNKILGQIHDAVDRVPFEPAWELPFDKRILEVCTPDDHVLSEAWDIKCEYDEAIRRLMTQNAIKTEFEVWSTFILEHNHESRDFKIAEELGETVAALKQHFRGVCCEKAGTTATARDWDKLKPFVAAMYTVTAHEVVQANQECEARHLVAGQLVPDRQMIPETMPLMSFPWLFQRELGDIAMGRDSTTSRAATESMTRKPRTMTPLDPVSPSISTAPDSASKTTASLISGHVKTYIRMDSPDCLLPPLEPVDTQADQSFLNGITNQHGSIFSTLFGTEAIDPMPADAEISGKVLRESRAFESSDSGEVEKGLADIEVLPEGASGKHESNPVAKPEGQPVSGVGDVVERCKDFPGIGSDNGGDVEIDSRNNVMKEGSLRADEKQAVTQVTIKVEESSALEQLEALYG